MKLSDFLKEKLLHIVSILLAIIITTSLLLILEPGGGLVLSLLLVVLYLLGTIIPLTSEYLKKRSFYGNLLRIFDSLDKKNLIAEVVTPPDFKEGMILYEIIRGSNKAMLDEISRFRRMQEEYREYIELWIHEVKTPISASRLITYNNKNDVMDSLSEELDKIEAYVEQVLYYSRSNTVEKDYIIKEIHLQRLCFDTLKKSSALFIQNRIRVITESLDVTVYSDEKWLQFILNQVLTNSVKYSDKAEAIVKITARELENSVVLSIRDKGTGISKSDLPRIFDKGFTGFNGRKNERSTGIGLYICKKLCAKLGLDIKASSNVGEGTEISITLPKSSMHDIISIPNGGKPPIPPRYG